MLLGDDITIPGNGKFLNRGFGTTNRKKKNDAG